MNKKKIDYQRSKVAVTEVKTSEHQKPNTVTAVLKQQVIKTTTYPANQVTDGASDSLVSLDAFSIGEGKKYVHKSTRVFFLNLPSTINGQPMTKEIAMELIKNQYEGGGYPCIQQRISNSPVLSPNQKQAVVSNKRTMDFYANKQAIRYGGNGADAGKLILDDNNNPMYKNNFYYNTLQEDVNLCGGDVYMSPEIKAEIQSMGLLSEDNFQVEDFVGEEDYSFDF